LLAFVTKLYSFPHPRTIPEIEKVLEELRKLVQYYKVKSTFLLLIYLLDIKVRLIK